MSAGPHLDDALLLARLAGDLEPSEAVRVQAHLDRCDACTRSLAAFREVHGALLAAREEPSPFASARMQRALGQALDEGHARPPRLVRRSRAVTAVAFAALSGAAVAMTAARTREAPPDASDPSVPAARFSEVEVASVPLQRAVPDRVEAIPLAVVPAPAAPSPVPLDPCDSGSNSPATPQRRNGPVPRCGVAALRENSTPRPDSRGPSKPSPEPLGLRVAIAPGTPSPEEALERAWRDALASETGADWVTLGDAFAQTGGLDRAVQAWVRGLASPAAAEAAERLSTAAREGLVGAGELLERLEQGGEGAEVLRLRCEWGLRYRGDRAAVRACQTFGRAYPAHPAVRTLALAAGQVAETRLADLPLAVAEYSRAIMVSEYAGVSSSEALLSRARARSRLGDREEGQADLRLYLHVAPEAYNRPDIRMLADALGVPAP